MKTFMQKFPHYSLPVNWFPGHMEKGIRLFGEQTSKVNLFLEVRDARLPYGSRNSQFQENIRRAQKHKIIIFNKADLSHLPYTRKIIKDYLQLGISCLQVSANSYQSIRQLLQNLRQRLSPKHQTVGTWIGICGMPNVGKSTIINQIRANSDLLKKNALTKTTPLPSTTRHRQPIKVFGNPPMYVVDSPGIMIPSNLPNQIGLKLSLLGIVSEKVINAQATLQYMVWHMNKEDRHEYYKREGLTHRPANAQELLNVVRQRKKLQSQERGQAFILQRFREGYYGGHSLERPVE